jgi:predicted AlkP superfamily pyrophosphatase or phosphodiesterase
MSRSLNRLLVIDVVGLTQDLLRHAPGLQGLANHGFGAPMDGVFPGVTCTAQTTLLTGALPREHGIVANGWFFRDLAEVWLWRQSNALVGGSQLDAELAQEGGTCARLFWWYNMYSASQFSVTPRPVYPADGRKLPDVYSRPASLRAELQQRHGSFPLFQFWGPTASLASTSWIVDASLDVLRLQQPDLALVYLPHLDYDLQRLGPDHPQIAREVAAVDAEAMRLVEAAQAEGRQVVVLSEYGITAAHRAVAVNRVLRRGGFLQVQDTVHGELLDAGESRAFAVADHQVAHVYLRSPTHRSAVQSLLESTAGVERVYDREAQRELGIDHERSGELVAVSERDAYFAYHYWEDDDKAPDFARTVDIHRKPGYDPSELFFDPDATGLKPKLALTLLRKKLGFRYLMRAISLRPDLAQGSHGRLPDRPEEAPVFLSSARADAADQVAMTSVKSRLWARLRGEVSS